MSKCYSNVRFDRYSLITIAIIAIISIILHLSFPDHSIVAKTNKNAKIIKNQTNSCDIKTSSVFDETKKFNFENKINTANAKENILTDKKENGKVLAVKIDKEDIITNQNEKSNANTKKLVLVTAFSSTVDQTDSTPFITASGTHVHDGTIAANFLKFGTKVKFPSLYGDKIFTVEDRMKSNYKVDIWFPTRQEALNFGAKRLEMEILP